MEKLTKLHKILHEMMGKAVTDYHIPARWLSIYNNDQISHNASDNVLVNPYEYYYNAVDYILNNPKQSTKNSIDGSVMFSILVRTFTAWQHYSDEEICSGTFLKSIAMLPYIKSMGVDVIYLLPIFKVSSAYKKGELGSPYSIKNIMQIEPTLADPLVPNMTAEEQFEAFCQAAHLLGMKVMLDFVFRTCSRDSDLLKEHPDWFYWVKPDKSENIQCPQIEGLGHTVVSTKNVDKLYNPDNMLPYANCFVNPPQLEVWQKEIDFDKDILAQANEKLNINIMPGFADTINDPQPPWTDITYLKFYFDGTKNAHNFSIKHGIDAPFIAQDGVKCSIFEGDQPNEQLWDYIENAIPHYIALGIDGARIDMGHALPYKLNQRIIKAARDKKPDFLFWSEEFSTANSGKAKQQGNDFITGDLWMLWKDKTACRRNSALLKAIQSELPVTAAIEMADTPRAMQTLVDAEHSIAAMVTTAFLPNSVMLINNGQELGEVQPMNLGLQNDENGRFMLDKSDKLYGKLAFFDKFYFNWNNSNAHCIYKAICDVANIKNKYREIIKLEYLQTELFDKRGAVQTIYYTNKKAYLCVIINNAQKARKLNQILPQLPISFNMSDCILKINCDDKNMNGGSVIIFAGEE